MKVVRGIPFDNIIRIFTKQHTSSNYDKTEGEFSAGRHGVGSKVTNALSTEFFVESYNSVLKEARRVEFYDGKPWDKGELKLPNKDSQGTTVLFRPSYKVMGEITTTCEDVLKLVSTLLPLVKIGTVVDFNGIDVNGNVNKQKLTNEDGIITYLINKTTNPFIKPVMISKVTGTMKAEIAFTYDSNTHNILDDITSFGNFCPTISGTHVDGFIEGVTKFFREYVNKIYLKGNAKVPIVNNDIKTGLKGIISVAHLEPIFTGQAKEILSNDDIFWFVRNLVLDSLDQWTKENPNDLQKLCKYFKEIAEIRVKSDEDRINVSKKYQASSITNLPQKFRKPSGDKNLELIIIEGDSALSSAVNARCPKRQGVYPLKGKPPNALNTDRKKFLNNDEMNGLIHIIGDGKFGKNFDLSKCRWEKIILVPDADPDGNHIRSLLLNFFLIYYPQLIIDGRLYGAVSPLFGLKVKNGYKYFTTKLDFVKYVQAKFNETNRVNKKDGSILSNNEVMSILYNNLYYTYELEKIANTYAINPLLLEQFLYNRNLDFKRFKEVIVNNNRFIKTVEQEKDSIIIKGLFGDKFHTVIFNDKLIKDCGPIFGYIDGHDLYYNVNGSIVSLYGLMKEFDRCKPKYPNLGRFKGLGEMNHAQLRESTLHPDYNRTLMKFNIADLAKEEEEIRYINSNKGQLLKDIKVSKLDML